MGYILASIGLTLLLAFYFFSFISFVPYNEVVDGVSKRNPRIYEIIFNIQNNKILDYEYHNEVTILFYLTVAFFIMLFVLLFIYKLIDKNGKLKTYRILYFVITLITLIISLTSIIFSSLLYVYYSHNYKYAWVITLFIQLNQLASFICVLFTLRIIKYDRERNTEFTTNYKYIDDPFRATAKAKKFFKSKETEILKDFYDSTKDLR